MGMNETRDSSARTQRWVLTLTAIASLMVMLDVMVVATALNTIRLSLGATIAELQWTLNAFTLSFGVLLMTGAALGDRFGRRRLLVIGLGVFTAASAAGALASSVDRLLAARAVQGAASAMIMPHALTLLSAAFPPERRARALGFFSSVTGLGLLAGPAIGGAVVQGLAWQWIFWLNVPIGLALMPLVARRVDEGVGARARLDLGGLALVMPGTLALVWGLVRANVAGWASLEVVSALAAGAALLVAFVRWELRSAQPMLPMHYFRLRAFSAGNASTFLMAGALYGAVFFFAQYLQTTLGYPPLAAGLRMVPLTATLFVVAPIAGGLVNRVGERQLIVGGLLLLGAGLASIGLLTASGAGYPALVLAGAGASLAIPAAQNAVIGAVPPPAIGTASGAFNSLRQLGGTFGVAVLAAVFAANGSYASPAAFGQGFAAAVGAGAAMSVAGAVIGLWAPGRRDAASAEGRPPGLGTRGSRTDRVVGTARARSEA